MTRFCAPTACFVAFVSLVFTTQQATAEPLSNQEIEGILNELTVIDDVLNGERVSIRTSAVRAFEAAAASDKSVYEFYIQCHKTLKFDAKDASFSEFRQWRERNEESLKDPGNLAAMRLQLQYLVISLKAAEGVPIESLIPELEAFSANVVNNIEDLGPAGMRTLRESVKRTIFAEAYKLDKSLEVKNWCYEPGNFGEIYNKIVFPYFREEQKAGLPAAWDRLIDLEKKLVFIRHEENQYELDKFESERLPQIYWSKAVDLYQNVSQQQGAQAMLSIIKGNPGHTSLKNWVEQFRNLLQSSAAQSAPAETATPDPAPAGDQKNPLGFE